MRLPSAAFPAVCSSRVGYFPAGRRVPSSVSSHICRFNEKKGSRRYTEIPLFIQVVPKGGLARTSLGGPRHRPWRPRRRLTRSQARPFPPARRLTLTRSRVSLRRPPRGLPRSPPLALRGYLPVLAEVPGTHSCRWRDRNVPRKCPGPECPAQPAAPRTRIRPSYHPRPDPRRRLPRIGVPSGRRSLRVSPPPPQVAEQSPVPPAPTPTLPRPQARSRQLSSLGLKRPAHAGGKEAVGSGPEVSPVPPAGSPIVKWAPPHRLVPTRRIPPWSETIL
jgi:hypothetical protein